MRGRLRDWAAATVREWGDELYYPHRAAFMQMQGGSVRLPSAEQERIERIGKAVWRTGPVLRNVLHAHYRQGVNLVRLAEALSRRAGRQVWVREVSRLVDDAVLKAEQEYMRMEHP